MNKIFIGFIFAVVDFNINLSSSSGMLAGVFSINLVPDIVGYTLMALGCGELINKSDNFSSARTVSYLLAGLQLIKIILRALNLSILNFSISIIKAQYSFMGLLDIISTVGFLAAAYLIVYAVSDIEQADGEYLGADSLKTYWLLMAAAYTVSYMFLFLMLPSPAGVMSIGALVFTIMFIISFFKTKRLYEIPKDVY